MILQLLSLSNGIQMVCQLRNDMQCKMNPRRQQHHCSMAQCSISILWLLRTQHQWLPSISKQQPGTCYVGPYLGQIAASHSHIPAAWFAVQRNQAARCLLRTGRQVSTGFAVEVSPAAVAGASMAGASRAFQGLHDI